MVLVANNISGKYPEVVKMEVSPGKLYKVILVKVPAGSVVNVTKDKNGKAHVATAKTTKGLYVRPIMKLIPYNAI